MRRVATAAKRALVTTLTARLCKARRGEGGRGQGGDGKRRGMRVALLGGGWHRGVGARNEEGTEEGRRMKKKGKAHGECGTNEGKGA